MTQDNHGGRRKGAGRPKADAPKVSASVRVTEATAAELAQRAGTVTAGLQRLAESWAALPEPAKSDLLTR